MGYEAKETYLYGKRGLPITRFSMHIVDNQTAVDRFMRQKRPTYTAKETYLQGKRDLLIRPRCRPLPPRDLLTRQKRPTYKAKEAYLDGLVAVLCHQDSFNAHVYG